MHAMSSNNSSQDSMLTSLVCAKHVQGKKDKKKDKKNKAKPKRKQAAKKEKKAMYLSRLNL